MKEPDAGSYWAQGLGWVRSFLYCGQLIIDRPHGQHAERRNKPEEQIIGWFQVEQYPMHSRCPLRSTCNVDSGQHTQHAMLDAAQNRGG